MSETCPNCGGKGITGRLAPVMNGNQHKHGIGVTLLSVPGFSGIDLRVRGAITDGECSACAGTGSVDKAQYFRLTGTVS